MKNINPTPFPEVNQILQEVLESVKNVLGSHFIGMYLEGSLVSGDFDQASDIDFVVVTDEDLSEDDYSALQAMHTRFNRVGSGWAIQLEGSYISRHALRRFDPDHAHYPNIERGIGERLKMVYHDEPWIIHRYILRERGITLAGPDPKTLIDPVSPDDLRRAMLPLLHGWVLQMLNDPDEIVRRGYPSSYIVLTLCRILYTLELGDVVSKPKAASWATETVNEKWKTFIEQAWVKRQQYNPLTLGSDEMNQTLDFIQYTLERSQQVKTPSEKQNLIIRPLNRDELSHISEIDVTEDGDRIYRNVDGGLVAEPENWHRPRWDTEECQRRIAAITAEMDRGDTVLGAFDELRLVGAASLRYRLTQDMAQLVSLHVSQSYRRRGVATALVDEILRLARDSGAQRIYVSATPSASAVGFYRQKGFELAEQVNEVLFALEPEDIHMIKGLGSTQSR